MGLFGDHAETYYNSNINVIPVGAGKDQKAPLIKNWSDYCERRMTDDEFKQLIENYSASEKIGLPLGPANKIVAFDYDYEYDRDRCRLTESEFKKDKRYVETIILSSLPSTPCRKSGKKGFTNFYKYNHLLENISINRNGVRCFDFLSTGRQTIIPPSPHSRNNNGDPIVYRWIDEQLLFAIDELPDLPPAIIQDLAFMLGEKDTINPNSRHSKIFNFTIGLCKIEQDQEKVISAMIKEDSKLHQNHEKGPYLTDKNHHQSNNARTNAEYWLKRISKYTQKLPNNTTENTWEYFFKHSLPFEEFRKDILTEKLFFKMPNQSWKLGEELIPTMRVKAIELGLKRSEVEDQFKHFQIFHEKMDLLCDIDPWDNKDHLKEFTNRLHSPDFTQEEIYQIFLSWGVGVFKKIHNSDYQNPCIILKGNQGIGKDTWVRQLVGALTPYYQSVEVRGDSTELVDAVQRVFVVHIEEFDRTKSLDPGALKAMITNPSVFMRQKYAHGATEQKLRASWICSANVDDLLRDPTGSRRFIVMNLEKIDWAEQKEVSRGVIGQFKALYDQGFRVDLPKPLKEKIKSIMDRYTPDDPEELIEEMFIAHLENLVQGEFKRYKPVAECQHMIHELARLNGVTIRKVQRIAKKCQRVVRDGDKVFRAYFLDT